MTTLNDKNRTKIARDMLHRYTGLKSQEIYPYILLTNFSKYLEKFAKDCNTEIKDGSVLRAASDKKNKITMIQFHIGAPTAALIVDLLATIHPKAVLMLGLCGGLHRALKVGEFIIPMAAIRNEGVSKHYMPESVPSLPTFKIQHILSSTLNQMKVPYKTGVVHSTDYRFWEFNQEFRSRLKKEKALVIEMECSALFTVGFKMKVPIGALLLVSDLPLTADGIKTHKLQKEVYRKHLSKHIQIGTETLLNLKNVHEEIDLRHFQW